MLGVLVKNSADSCQNREFLTQEFLTLAAKEESSKKRSISLMDTHKRREACEWRDGDHLICLSFAPFHQVVHNDKNSRHSTTKNLGWVSYLEFKWF